MWKTFSAGQKLFMFLAFVHFCSTLFTISITPYGDYRYFSLIHLNTFIAAAICIGNLFHRNPMRPFREVTQLAMIAILIGTAFSGPNIDRIKTGVSVKTLIPQNTDKLKTYYAAIEQIVQKHVKADDILAVKPNADGYAAFTGRRTVYFPSTIYTGKHVLAKWIKAWSVDYLLLPKSTAVGLRLDRFVIDSVFDAKLVDANAFLKSKRK
jgi:hypothetical protein